MIDGKTGFLVEVGDAEKFAELIDHVLTMPKAEADQMGIAARKNVEENFSSERMCSETIKVYEDVLRSVFPAA